MLCERILRHAFRVPLHTDDPIVVRGPFHAFDEAVLGQAGHSEIFPGLIDRLVMAGVDGDGVRARKFGKEASLSKLGDVLEIR